MNKFNILPECVYCKNSKKYTKSFREYYEDLLQESPLRTGTHEPEYYDNRTYNTEKAIEMINNYTPIDTINKEGKYKVDLYEDVNKDIRYWYFIIEDTKMIAGYIYFRKNDNNIQTCGIWNHIATKGLIYWLFVNYLLPKFKLLISDNQTTTQGEIFWKKIMKYGLENSKRVGIYYEDIKKFVPLDNLEQFEYAWASTTSNLQRVWIEN